MTSLYRFEEAKYILALDSDFLQSEAGAVRWARVKVVAFMSGCFSGINRTNCWSLSVPDAPYCASTVGPGQALSPDRVRSPHGLGQAANRKS